jgi:hypothetical protein
MSGTKAHQIVLAARPQGKPRLTDFRLEETAAARSTSRTASSSRRRSGQINACARRSYTTEADWS